MENELYHYGTPRHSGRYPWGSGEDPYQHEAVGFLGQVRTMKKAGMSEVEIAKAMGINTSVLRSRITIAKEEETAARRSQAYQLKENGYTNTKIAEKLGVTEGTVRNLLKPAEEVKKNSTINTANALKDAVKENQFIDIGLGSEAYLGVSRTKLGASVEVLKQEGYEVYKIRVEQQGTGNYTTMQILCPPGTKYGEVYQNLDKISPVMGRYSNDEGQTFSVIKTPVSVNPDRVAIRYAEDGGVLKDGVIELRRGAEDLSLGEANYAQVRIQVGKDKYLKGMAVYADDLPDGVDIMFNTNKGKEKTKEQVMKDLKDDPDNPFGANIAHQRDYIGADGKLHQSPLNIVREEGEWDTWSKTLSTQVLSKQPPSLAKQQLDKAYAEREQEFDKIMALTNPAVKQKLLQSFADDCDAAAVHLEAAALPRQSWKVILPVNQISDKEIYAPGYRDGEKVVLVRYPHGGKFEIPELTVNNKSRTAKQILGEARDAVGINHKVAERLSGADFDGDTVLVIPNDAGKIKTAPSLKGLKNFDPQAQYKAYDGMPEVGMKTGFNRGKEMGSVSNLITDMTIKGASQDEIARAVRHSMVVIDAEKHNLNWRQSYEDNGIADLKEKYQGGARRGASTLISKAGAREEVPHRKQRSGKAGIDPLTGEKIYYETGETYTKRRKNEAGEWVTVKENVPRTTRSTKMAEAKNAFDLSSGTVIEDTYAAYANKVKALANQARKAYVETPNQKYNPSANKVYAAQVESLKEKLLVAKRNAPLERQAQLQAGLVVKAKRAANPDMDREHVQREKARALETARVRVGASGKKTRIQITPTEWAAIQAGAITHNTLSEILQRADMDVVRQLATPRQNRGVSSSELARARALLANGYTQSQVADQLGMSVSTLNRALNE